jgi:hypothetical protein
VLAGNLLRFVTTNPIRRHAARSSKRFTQLMAVLIDTP